MFDDRKEWMLENFRINNGFDWLVVRTTERHIVRTFVKTCEDADWAMRMLPDLANETSRTAFSRNSFNYKNPDWGLEWGHVSSEWLDKQEKISQ